MIPCFLFRIGFCFWLHLKIRKKMIPFITFFFLHLSIFFVWSFCLSYYKVIGGGKDKKYWKNTKPILVLQYSNVTSISLRCRFQFVFVHVWQGVKLVLIYFGNEHVHLGSFIVHKVVDYGFIYFAYFE